MKKLKYLLLILLMPVIASLGIPVAKISSRGYGISGGTIDKLESIPGFDTEISMGQLKNNINNIGIGIVGQNLNFAPAESKMYKLRNQIGCSDSLPLIAASLIQPRTSPNFQSTVLISLLFCYLYPTESLEFRLGGVSPKEFVDSVKQQAVQEF